jgi:hypothetical protein
LLQEQDAWIDRLRPESKLEEELRQKHCHHERHLGLDSLPRDHPTSTSVLALEDQGVMVPPWY